MIMNILLILIAILPGLLIAIYIYFMDKYEREGSLALLLCFILGMIITIPGLALQTWVDNMGYSEHGSLLWTLFFSMVVIGLSEELLKFGALLAYPFRSKFFNEPMDGIVYCVMIGMGFATLENILYATRYGMEVTVVRAFTAVPAHAVFAIIMGYYAGLAKFNPIKRNQLLLIGFTIATFIHGLYDFFILQQAYEWLMVAATLTLYVSIFFAIKMVKKHQRNSPFITPNGKPLPEDNDSFSINTTEDK